MTCLGPRSEKVRDLLNIPGTFTKQETETTWHTMWQHRKRKYYYLRKQEVQNWFCHEANRKRKYYYLRKQEVLLSFLLSLLLSLPNRYIIGIR